MQSWRLRSVLVVIGLAVFLGAAGPTVNARTLIIGESNDISNLDPHASSQRANYTSYDLIFEKLATWSPQQELIPTLAVSWENIEPTVWHFQLRENVTFTNGEPFNADVVKYNIERIQNPSERIANRTLFEGIVDVEVVDEHVVNIVTEQPDPLLPARFAGHSAAMVPPQHIQHIGSENLTNDPVGTGPYKLVQWIKGDRVILEANPEYWGGPPNFDRIEVRGIPEPAARAAAVLAGEVDIAVNIPPDLADYVDSSGRARIVGVPVTTLTILIPNVDVYPLSDKRFRQALSLAVDREAILYGLKQGRGVLPNGPIPTTDFAYDPDRPPLEYNPEKARELLAEMGYQGETIVIESTSGHIMADRDISEALQAMWQSIGVNTQVEVVEAAITDEMDRGIRPPKGLRLGSPSSALFDPDGHVWRTAAPGGIYDHGWYHEAFARGMIENKYVLDADEREENYRHLLYDIFMEEMPWIIIDQMASIYAVSPSLEWTPRPDNRAYPWEMERRP